MNLLRAFKHIPLKSGSENLGLLNAFLQPVPGKNMRQAKVGNFHQDLVIPDDAGIITGGF